jgi:hypothetical protein
MGRADLADEAAIGDFPNLDFAAARGDAAAGGEPLAIGAEVEGEDAIGERGFFVPGADGAAEGPGRAAAPDDRAIFLRAGEDASVAGVGQGADGAERTGEGVEAGAIGGAPGVDDLSLSAAAFLALSTSSVAFFRATADLSEPALASARALSASFADSSAVLTPRAALVFAVSAVFTASWAAVLALSSGVGVDGAAGLVESLGAGVAGAALGILSSAAFLSVSVLSAAATLSFAFFKASALAVCALVVVSMALFQ